MDTNVFKPITYPGVFTGRYSINCSGEVYNAYIGRVMAPTEDKGYLRVRLKQENGRFRRIFVHRLVAWEFCEGYSDTNRIINHKDSNRSNNHYTNLEWCNYSHNNKHAVTMGNNDIRGTLNVTNIHSEELVHNICQLLCDCLTSQEIMSRMGFDKIKDNSKLYDLINCLKYRKTWKHITDLYDYKFIKTKVSVDLETVEIICELVSKGLSNSQIGMYIASKGVYPYNKIKSLCKSIKQGKSYASIFQRYVK